MSNKAPHGEITCIVCLADKPHGQFVYITRDGEQVEYGRGEMWPCCKQCWAMLQESPAAVLERVAPFGFTERGYNPHQSGY